MMPAPCQTIVCAFLLLFALPFLATRAEADADSKSAARGVRSDVPYIQCETCAHVVEAAVNETNKLEGTHLTELALFDMVESLCDPNAPVGKWTTTIDLQERLRKLHLVKQDATQPCKQECRTIALACSQVLDSVETEFAERLYLLRKKGPVDVKHIQSWFCDKGGLSSACAETTPRFPKSRPTGPPFEPRDEKQAAIDEAMKKIRADENGFSMNAMDPDAMGAYSTDDDVDDDDDDDDVDHDGNDNAASPQNHDHPDEHGTFDFDETDVHKDDGHDKHAPHDVTTETDKDEI